MSHSFQGRTDFSPELSRKFLTSMLSRLYFEIGDEGLTGHFVFERGVAHGMKKGSRRADNAVLYIESIGIRDFLNSGDLRIPYESADGRGQ